MRAREHRLWWRRGGRGGGGIELEGLNVRAAKISDLPGLRLVDCDLSRSTLLGDLTKLDLEGCLIDSVKIDGHLSQAELLRCRGYTVSMANARLVRARLERTVLGRSDLSRTDMTRMYARRCDFTASDFSDATLTRATFRQCSFRDAILVGHKRRGPFGETELTRFFGCDFRGVDWQGRRLAGVTFDRCAFYGGRGVPVVERECQIVCPDFSPEFDGSDVGLPERLLGEWGIV